MNIVCAFNENYRCLVMVMMCSLIQNNTGNICIYVLESSLTKETKDRFQTMFASERVTIRFCHVKAEDEATFESLQHDKRMTPESYYRFLVLREDYIPQEVSRILWLDVDIVINRSIEEFYRQPFEGNWFAACKDRTDKGDSVWEHFHSVMKAPEEVPYFNAGVLLFRLDLLREKVTLEQLLLYEKDNHKRLLLGDQDILNGYFMGKIKEGNAAKYNCMIRDRDSLCSRQVKQIRQTACILHFTSNVKPPERKYHQRLENIFWKYGKQIHEYRAAYYFYCLKKCDYGARELAKKVLRRDKKL